MGGCRRLTSKMGGVETSALKNGGSVDGCPEKWGGYICAAEGRALLSTPPLRVYLAPSLKNNKKALQYFLNIKKTFIFSYKKLLGTAVTKLLIAMGLGVFVSHCSCSLPEQRFCEALVELSI